MKLIQLDLYYKKLMISTMTINIHLVTRLVLYLALKLVMDKYANVRCHSRKKTLYVNGRQTSTQSIKCIL
jgi:hypothetical protein